MINYDVVWKPGKDVQDRKLYPPITADNFDIGSIIYWKDRYWVVKIKDIYNTWTRVRWYHFISRHRIKKAGWLAWLG